MCVCVTGRFCRRINIPPSQQELLKCRHTHTHAINTATHIHTYSRLLTSKHRCLVAVAVNCEFSVVWLCGGNDSCLITMQRAAQKQQQQLEAGIKRRGRALGVIRTC